MPVQKTPVTAEQQHMINKETEVSNTGYAVPNGAFNSLAERLEYLGYPKQDEYGIRRTAWICGCSKDTNVRRMVHKGKDDEGYKIESRMGKVPGTKTPKLFITYAEVERYYLFRTANLLGSLQPYSDPETFSEAMHATKKKSFEEQLAARLSPEVLAVVMAALAKGK